MTNTTQNKSYFQKEQDRLDHYRGIKELSPAKEISKTHKALYYLYLLRKETLISEGREPMLDSFCTATRKHLLEEIKNNQ